MLCIGEVDVFSVVSNEQLPSTANSNYTAIVHLHSPIKIQLLTNYLTTKVEVSAPPPHLNAVSLTARLPMNNARTNDKTSLWNETGQTRPSAKTNPARISISQSKIIIIYWLTFYFSQYPGTSNVYIVHINTK